MDYDDAKATFAERSGLVDKARQFSNDQLEDVFRCLGFTKDMNDSLTYNAFRKNDSIGVSGKTTPLIQYTYKNGTGRLKEMTYADGSTVKMTYNRLGKVCAEKWYNSNNTLVAHYKYVYDGNGNIVISLDILDNKEYNYTYSGGKLTRCTESVITIGDNEIITGKTVLNTIYYVFNSDGVTTSSPVIMIRVSLVSLMLMTLPTPLLRDIICFSIVKIVLHQWLIITEKFHNG